MHKLKVGQQLYFVPRCHPQKARYLEVAKVGRKWAYTLDDYMIDLESLHVSRPGYSSLGTVYETIEEYSEKTAKADAWIMLKSLVSCIYRVPKNTRFLG